jgi:ABC-type transporter Mla subunit MlaD
MASRKDRNAFKAGLFIIISVALIVALILGIKGIGRFVVPSQDREVRFALSDDIGGLSPGDEVRIGGAKVGVVRDVEIDPDGMGAGQQGNEHRPGILIEFMMPQRFVIRQNAEISVQSTVTGVSVLNFSSLGDGTPVPESEVLMGKPGGLSSLLASAGQIGPEALGLLRDVRGTTVPKVDTAVDSANTLIRHVEGKVDPIAQKGGDALDAVSGLFGDTKTDFRATIANLNAVTATIRDKLPAIMDQTHGLLTKVNTAIDRTNGALLDIQSVAANTRDISASARQIILGNRGKIEQMISSLRDTGENLKNASAEISRSPWRLLYHPSAGEMANLNLYDSARQFADGANNLSDAATSLRDALQCKVDNPEQLKRLVQKLNDSFAHFNEVENRLWSQVKE